MAAHKRGFTIVELLIVIVVIGILAALAIGALSRAQDQARNAKIQSDIQAIRKSAVAAKEATGRTLFSLNTNGGTASSCVSKPTGTDLAALPRTDACWVDYANALDKISIASGNNIRNIVDPWGRPYALDENENEGGPSYCVKDTIASFPQPFVTGWAARQNIKDITNISSPCV